jgi:molybdate-binding protein/DNA-binding transcriptional regulator YhcF (GntR family)
MHRTQSFLYLEIAESIRLLIASGGLAPGDKLLPVRKMAQQWNCTPATAGRAYATLAQEGLVESHRGGGTRVTRNTLQPEQPVWRWASLVNRAEQFLLAAISGGHSPQQTEAALSVAISRWRDAQSRGAPEALASVQPRRATLRFAGSNDLLIESLVRMLSRHSTGTHLSTEYNGSLGGLMAVARNEADIAGTHLWDEATNSYNIPYVRRLLVGRRLVLLTVAHRSLGLMLPAGNPQALGRLEELERTGVRLVSRQPGSGTRVWLDAQLEALDIEPSSIPGYEREEMTHLAVARAVGRGEATVGLGIYAAAAAEGLTFVPLTQERYDLVIPDEVWQTPAAQALTEIIRSPGFKDAIASLGGYDASETGREQWVP